jgi:SpoIIAA-like
MIKIEPVSNNVLEITAPPTLEANDFQKIAPQVDSMISRFGKVRLLIDATAFNGWENVAAFENHAGFVKDHQQKVERIAVIIGHEWQRWLVGTVRIFLHPAVRAFGKDQEGEALQWIVE